MMCVILGCGSSSGVPEIGCACYVCLSDNIKNKRLRSSIYIRSKETSLLIDTSPDLKAQALRHGIVSLDAVLYTHAHQDHLAGIDDLKNINGASSPIPVFFDKEASIQIIDKALHMFTQISEIYQPKLIANIIKGSFRVKNLNVIPFLQNHGKIKSVGMRIEDLAYTVDFSDLTEEMEEHLRGVKVWIVDCLRYAWAPTHAYLEKTLNWIAKVKPERAILTHMSHDIDYEEIKHFLPSNVVAAYDGMVIEV